MTDNETHEEYVKRRVGELKQLEQATHLEAAKWRDDPNVSHLGWGRRMKDGQITDELAVIFFVREKATTDGELFVLGTRRIPAELDGGFASDVIQMNLVGHADDTVGQRGHDSYDPLVGGVQTANADNHMAFWGYYGTLGTLCWNEGDSTPLALSNWHVWAAGSEQGDTIIQPGHPTTGDYAEAGARLLFCGGSVITHLIDWNAPSPLTDGLAAAAAAAWTAAGLSDVADPIRRGQLATTPATATERTLREQVKVALTPINDPLPGTPFGVGVKWSYQRTTDAAIYSYDVSEVQHNEHLLTLKHLWSDLDNYSGVQQVTLFAEVVTPRQLRADFHLAAQIVAPDEQSKRSVIFAPAPPLLPQLYCVSFECDADGIGFSADYARGAMEFHAPPPRFNRVFDRFPVGGDGKGELVLYDGHAVTLPDVREVRIELVPIAGPLTVRAFSRGTEVAHQTTSAAPMTSELVSISAPGNDIDRIEVHGDPAAALMLKLCYSRGASHVNKSSFYRGSFTLDPRAALGCDKAYLYVQTVNDVAPGTNALAAQTIGGLAAGQNLTTQPSASGGCAFCMVLDYTFHVIVPPPPVLK
jgi:hypothetical protein